MPDVDDLPTDDALRFGRFRVVLRSFEDFALDVGLLLNPMKYLRALVEGLVSGESCSTSRIWGGYMRNLRKRLTKRICTSSLVINQKLNSKKKT